MRFGGLFRLSGLLLTALLSAGCGPTETQVERAIERELPKLVGPADRYQVEIEGMSGTRRAKRLSAVGQRVRVDGVPVLHRVEVALKDVAYDPQRRQLERVGDATVAAWVRLTDIAAYLEGLPSLDDVVVDLQPPDEAVIYARPVLPELSLTPGTRVVVTGRLTRDRPRVNFVVTNVAAGHALLPGNAADLLSAEINPLVDLSAIPVALQITELRVEEAEIRAGARGCYPPAP